MLLEQIQETKPKAKPIRVLVVDDSALMRKLISEMLNTQTGIEVAGTARDGADGLQKARELRPDVITLDVEMPNMNGLEFLEQLMTELPTPVVMVSSLTAKASETTLACLTRGAVDFVEKPSGSISVDLNKRAEEIIEKVRAAAGAKVRVSTSTRSPMSAGIKNLPTPPRNGQHRQDSPVTRPIGTNATKLVTRSVIGGRSPASGGKQTFKIDRKTIIVAIASSTGGPSALHEVLPNLPGDLNAAYIVVQHLPAGFTRSLADRMNTICALSAREAQAGDYLERGLILIAPGGHHLSLDEQGMVALQDDPPLWGVRPAADVMMHSVANYFGARAIGVVLTGMGRDGAMGARAIHVKSGRCLAQNEATCVVYGMPRAALEAGGVDRVVPLQDMAGAIVQQIETMLKESAAA